MADNGFPTLELSDKHVILLGDAILPDIGNLNDPLGPGFNGRLSLVSLKEMSDGNGLPNDATHAVVCLEGNEAIAESGLLDGAPAPYRESLARLSFAADAFEHMIEPLITTALGSGLLTLVCTGFKPRYDEPQRQQAALAALAIFNERIISRAVASRLSIVDLRLVVGYPDDYSSATRLAPQGLQKAVGVIRRALDEADMGAIRTRVYI